MTGDFGGVQVVWVDMKQKPRDLVDTVIHESVHVFQHMLAHIGETSVGKESQAYGIAFIATTLLGELENHIAVHEERPQDGEDGSGLCSGERALQFETGTTEEPQRTLGGTSPSE